MSNGNGALEQFGQALRRIRRAASIAAALEEEGFGDSRESLESEVERLFGELHPCLDAAYRELAPLSPRERHQALAALLGDDIETAWWLRQMGLNN